MDKKLTEYLLSKEYKLLNSNVEGIYLLYKEMDSEVVAIGVFRTLTGNEFTLEQYKFILSKMKADFANRGFSQVKLLNLIFTHYPDKVKQLCLEEDEHWIIDQMALRLIIYETQVNDFYGLREVIEKILEEEFKDQNQKQQQVNGESQDYPYRMPGYTLKNQLRRILTPMNLMIIGINIIAFLVMQYLRYFRGMDRIISKGALNWYEVIEENEYYRLFTALFMHLNINHIFNNMIVLLFVGANLERTIGKLKYLFLYFGSGILADITTIGYNMWMDRYNNEVTLGYSIGASGAVFGVVGAVLYIIIVNKGRLEDISFRQMILFVIFGLYGGITNAGIDNAAHIGGFISGLLIAAILYRRPKRVNEFP
ncbi:MAG: hypothetical protein K0S76_1041 [Herbinix sp.]|jgi:rhomboid protease GluP|nr:hypothetical protein [Herbinix sp.]